MTPDSSTGDASPDIARPVHSEKTEGKVRLQWLIANALSYAVFFALVENSSAFYVVSPLGRAAIGLGVGLVVGLPQWWILKSRITGSKWWILSTSVGFALGYAILFGLLLKPDSSPPITRGAYASSANFEAELQRWGVGLGPGWAYGIFPSYTAGYALVGGIVGIGQWLILRGQVLRPARWILANPAAFAAGHVLGLPIGSSLGFIGIGSFLEFIGTPNVGRFVDASRVDVAFTGLAVGAVVGTITGAVLVRMLEEPPV